MAHDYDPLKPFEFVLPDREDIVGDIKLEPGIFGVRHELRAAINVPDDFRWRSNPKTWQEEFGTAIASPRAKNEVKEANEVKGK